MNEQKRTLKMKEFRVKVIVVPTRLESELFGTQPRTEWRTIAGYTLKDAKRRAGIQ